MIIKSHVRGGYRAAANCLKAVGANESIRLVEISDANAKDLDEAFRNMWMVGRTTRAKKPLHHVSINPYKDERLTDEQVIRICERLEAKYGYKSGDHQRVIVEHVKDGRQHFHVMWNRVSLRTGRPVWPGQHWKKSKQAARQMEVELGLKRPVPRRARAARIRRLPISRLMAPRRSLRHRRSQQIRAHACENRQQTIAVTPAESVKAVSRERSVARHTRAIRSPAGISIDDLLRSLRIALPSRKHGDRDEPDIAMPVRPKRESSIDELIAWAWEHRRADILALFGIYVTFDL